MSIDKKAMIREYKETPRTAGVAVVRNLASGKQFVFAGRDIPALVNRHRAQLKTGSHPNRMLQGDWQALGAEQFAFEIVDTLIPKDTPGWDPTDDLQALETLWLEKLQPFEPEGYNWLPKAKR